MLNFYHHSGHYVLWNHPRWYHHPYCCFVYYVLVSVIHEIQKSFFPFLVALVCKFNQDLLHAFLAYESFQKDPSKLNCSESLGLMLMACIWLKFQLILLYLKHFSVSNTNEAKRRKFYCFTFTVPLKMNYTTLRSNTFRYINFLSFLQITELVVIRFWNYKLRVMSCTVTGCCELFMLKLLLTNLEVTFRY